MCEKETEQGIIEYHCCSDCEYQMSIPTDPHFRSWECACKKRSPDVNTGGGLTRCTMFKEKVKHETMK